MADNPQYITDMQKKGYGALDASGLLSGINGWSGSVAPWNSNLGGAFDAAGLLSKNNTDWSRQIANSGDVTGSDIQGLMDPYAKAVGNDTVDAISRSYDDADAAAGARAASGVAFGGANSALALERGQMARDEAQQKESAVNGLLSQAYGQGAQLAGENASRGQSGLIAADNATSNNQNRGMDAINGLLSTGASREAYDQSTADLPWNNFMKYQGALPGGVNSDPVPVWQQILGYVAGLGGSALSGGLLNGVFKGATA